MLSPTLSNFDPAEAAATICGGLILALLGHLLFCLQSGQKQEALLKAITAVLIVILFVGSIKFVKWFCPECFRITTERSKGPAKAKKKPPAKQEPARRPKSCPPPKACCC